MFQASTTPVDKHIDMQPFLVFCDYETCFAFASSLLAHLPRKIVLCEAKQLESVIVPLHQ